MSAHQSNRRTFLHRGLSIGSGLALSGMTAASYARTIGANERIRIGLIGCGGRGRYLVGKLGKPEASQAAVVAVCDVWKSKLAQVADELGKAAGGHLETQYDYRRLLENPDIDAVIIATPDHQHAGQTIDAVQAGKHVYVEKPIIGLACDLPTLNKWHDTIKSSKVVVQNGTQGASSPAAVAIKQFIADKKFGKLFRIESTETAYRPYWVHYKGPGSEGDTDWKAWLYNRPERPFDANMHAQWMGYKEITSGTIGGWMTHFINTVHFVTGCGFPVSASAWGGRYAATNDPKCTAPDQTMVILDYAEGFHTQFTSHFGSEIDNETTVFMFEKGSIRTRFGHDPGNPIASSEGAKGEVKPYGLLPEEPISAIDIHVKNWLDCIRSGQQPNANVDFGYKQGVAVAMADLAWDLGRKVTFDQQDRTVRPI